MADFIPDDHEVIRSWDWDHRVAIARGEDGIEFLFCDCYADDSVGDQCEWYQRARSQIQREVERKLSGMVDEVGLESMILAISETINEGDYLGQSQPGIIYVQEVSDVLSVSEEEVLEAVDELFEERELELNGMILKEFEHGFRFPEEVRQFFRYMIEEPIGWPNGGAGMFTVRRMEEAIQENADWESGEDVFYEDNYPKVASHHLISSGLEWFIKGLKRRLEEGELGNTYALKRLEGKVEEALEIIRGAQNSTPSE